MWADFVFGQPYDQRLSLVKNNVQFTYLNLKQHSPAVKVKRPGVKFNAFPLLFLAPDERHINING